MAKKRKKGDEAQKGDEPAKKYTKPTYNLVLRVPPTSFMETVLKNMPDEHKKAIEEIGFGGFLHLYLPYHKSAFAEPLVRSLDVGRYCSVMQNNQVIDITEEDAHIAYEVPLGGKEVVEPSEESDTNWVSFLNKWRASYKLTSESPINPAVVMKLERQKKGPVNVEFLRNFVLCAVNYCIRSTCNHMLRFNLLYNCMYGGA